MTMNSGTRVVRVRHDIQVREVQVLRIERPSPNFRAVVFGGDSLEGFTSLSFDDHLKFILPGAGDGSAPVMRDYTPRRYDAAKRELTIEFSLHGDGPAAAWAGSATVGQRATVAGPRGSFVIPVDYEWHLLVGDESALPAIARRLEELPSGAQAIVIAQARDADRREFRTLANASIQWVAGAGQLLEALRGQALPPGEGYVWCAGEARTMGAVRRIVIDEKGHDKHAARVAAYWKDGVSAHHERIEEH